MKTEKIHGTEEAWESGALGLDERYVAVACDVLKVGHHGSAKGTQDAFLALVAPHAALVTCKADAALPGALAQILIGFFPAQVIRNAVIKE